MQWLGMVSETLLTDFLRAHGQIANTVLMNLDFSRQTLTIQCRPYESFSHFCWSSTFDFDEVPLFNDVGHFFLLLFAFIGLLLEVVDLLHDVV